MYNFRSGQILGKEEMEATNMNSVSNLEQPQRDFEGHRSVSPQAMFQPEDFAEPLSRKMSFKNRNGCGSWSEVKRPEIHQSNWIPSSQGQFHECQGHVNEGHFKVPKGHSGHYRTRSDGRHDFRGRQNDQYYNDEFDINWTDNHFYNPHDSYWTQDDDRYDRGRRRGSFDTGFRGYNHNGNRSWHTSEKIETPQRGRGIFRINKDHKRSASYDNISPESTSSSDSGLKRRHEHDDSVPPGKTRRRFDPPDWDVHHLPVTSQASSARSQINERSVQRPHSRSSSMDRLRDSGYCRSETESDSRLSGRKVTWSDQQVSSSTEKVESGSTSKSGSKTKDTNYGVMPDSSSESEGKNKSSKVKAKKRINSPKTSPARRGKSPSSVVSRQTGDQVGSVLERAEKLCKKLRSDRERAKMKKKEDEKSKKIEKEMELNKKIETLSEKNKSNIRGILDSDIPIKQRLGEVVKTNEKKGLPTSVVEPMSPETSVHKKQDKLTPSREDGSSNSSIVERIAQTKADIDAIRAKIEASVQKEMSQSGSSTDTVVPPKYPQATDRTSLVKMVNSPRTTKERLSLAQMFREHARSQTKLSLPRFNLKYSDLCSGSDKFDEYANINVESLAPNVQLQIANIIESDIKPDISELERLLDQASEGTAELDANFLNDLGIDTAGKSDSSNHYPTNQIETMTGNTTPRQPSPVLNRSPVRLPSASEDLPNTSDVKDKTRLSPGKEIQKQLPSLLSSPTVAERDMPGPKLCFQDTQIVRPDTVELPERDMPPPRGVLSMEDLIKDKEINSVTLSVPDNIAEPAVSSRLLSSVSKGAVDKRVGEKSADLSGYEQCLTNITIKQEKCDNGYDVALGHVGRCDSLNKTSNNVCSIEREEEGTPEAPGAALVPSGRFSPVTRSVHTMNLYRKEELPIRDHSRRYSGSQVITLTLGHHTG